MKRGIAVVVLVILGVSALPADAQEVSILNLYDAFGPEGQGTTRDWGYSAFIRFGDKTILFDAGNNADILEKNARALGVDLREVDLAVLSHRHNDHASGFDLFVRRNPNATLYLPPDGRLGLSSRWRTNVLPKDRHPELAPEEMYYGGDRQEGVGDPGDRFYGAKTEFVREHREVAPGIHLLVTRSDLVGDFSRYPPNDKQPRLSGFAELSLVLATEKGLVVVTGCSHSRVETIVRAARDLLNQDVELVIGGFHLIPYSSETIAELAKHMKETLGVQRVAPAHCTGHEGFKIFRQIFGKNYEYAGLGSKIQLSPETSATVR